MAVGAIQKQWRVSQAGFDGFLGRLDSDRGDVVFTFGEHACRFEATTLRQAGTSSGPSRPITLGVRPEGVDISQQRSADDLPGEVFLVEPVGAVTYVDLTVNGTTLKASVAPDLRLQPGDHVGVRFRKNRGYFFEQQGGVRL